MAQAIKPARQHVLCRDCGETKLAWEFVKDSRGRPRSPCLDCAAKLTTAHRHANLERCRAACRRRSRLLKEQVIDAYGGKCECCGESIIDFLSIDHANEDGKQHRSRLNVPIYVDLKMRGFPQDEGLRVQCYNCNLGRRAFTCCPHRFIDGSPIPFKRNTGISPQLKHRRTTGFAVRLEVIAAYGGACACCGEDNLHFLCIDHVHGDAKKDKAAGMPYCGNSLWQWLKNTGFPKDRFQLLCYNCNRAKGTKACCPHLLERA